VPQNIEQHVGAGVSFKDEAELATVLAQMKGVKLLADPHSANAYSQLLAQKGGAKLIVGTDPVALPKAQKNNAELAGIRACHIRAGAAVSRFLAWLDSQVEQNFMHAEAQLAAKLESFRNTRLRYNARQALTLFQPLVPMPLCAITITIMAPQAQ